MRRIALVARLKAGAEERAAELLAAGPPFDPAEDEIERHAVYLSREEVVFVFEGHEIEWKVDDLLTSDYFHRRVSESLAAWRELIEGEPRLAEEAYFWERRSDSGDREE
jgi:hypothetical protein